MNSAPPIVRLLSPVLLAFAVGLSVVPAQPTVAQVRTIRRFAPAPAPTSGRYRIVALGVHVDHETTDDMFERDGKRDEIYVAAGVQHVDRRDGRMIAVGMARTGVMGDVNGFPARIKAGSASSLGGVRTNDNVPAVADVASLVAPASASALPLLIWEGELRDGIDVVIVQPEVWEWDGGPNLFVDWQRGTTAPIISDSYIQDLITRQVLGPTYRLANWDQRLIRGDPSGQDIPIGGGISQSGQMFWHVNAIAVTREAVERAFAAGSTIGGRPPTTTEIIRDGYNQDYRMYLRVERVP